MMPHDHTICHDNPGSVSHEVDAAVRRALRESAVDRVVAGISGGADSVAMLLSLTRAAAEVVAVHCNFHLRGEESDRDMRFVQSLCHSLQVPLLIYDIDVEAYRREHHVSVEVACRETRYAIFRQQMSETGADRIAVAHNSDDQAETLLLNLMRGCGVAGLRAMLPDTGEILRPLLSVSRASILDYLDKLGCGYVTDSTNLESDFRRNFLRNDVLPLLATRWPHAKESICRTASIAAQEERMLSVIEQQLLGDNRNVLPIDRLLSAPDPVWLLRRFCAPLGANAAQCEEMLRVLTADTYTSGRSWHTQKGVISAERDRLEFVVQDDAYIPELVCEERQVDDALLAEVRVAGLDVLWTSLPPERLLVRPVRTGDRICPLGMKGSALVSKIMKDAKLSRARKLDVRVVADADTGEIIWVPGLKRSSLALVKPDCGMAYRYRLQCAGETLTQANSF